jgi:hypothetical protein
MSCVWCEGCDRLVDSDDDPEVFTQMGNGPILCEGCRDDAWSLEDELALRADNANDEAAMHGEA